MKNLKEYVYEGLADWEDDKLNKKISKQTTKSVIKNEIIDWLENNCSYKISKSKIKLNTSTTPWTLNYDGDIVFNYNITALTNGLFQWGEIGGDFIINHSNLKSLEDCPKYVEGEFNCSNCDSLKSLEGAPEVYSYGSFQCYCCNNLKSLEGCPEKVGRFNCSDCDNLKSLDGGPKIVKSFNCGYCKNLKSLKGAPDIIPIDFDCSHCTNLHSLEYVPSKVFGDFYCKNCGGRFTKEDVEKLSNVNGKIFC
jgi:hypothetical protein